MRETTRESRLVRACAVATAISVLAELVLVLGVRFRDLVHSDAVTALLMTKAAFAARSPLAPGWYWSNGDVWIFASPIAFLPTALLGVTIDSLRAVGVLGFGIELAVLVWCFRQLTSDRVVAWMAALSTLVCVSQAQFLFCYVELAYGFLLTTYLFVFILFARLDSGFAPRSHWAAAVMALIVVSASNPTRYLAYGIVPLLASVIWPWRGITVRSRAALGTAVLGGYAVSLVIARLGFAQWLTFAPYRSPPLVAPRGMDQVGENIVMYGRGLLLLAGGASWTAIAGALLMLGAFGLVASHVFRSRAFTRTRFIGLALVTALATVTGSLFVGNVLFAPLSIRYIMPAVLPMFGVAVVWCAEHGRSRWMLLLPIAGWLGFFRSLGEPLDRTSPQWSNRPAHVELATELSHRGLAHGFATYWHANLLTLLSENRSRVCPVVAGGNLVPYRWGVDASCFDRARFPERVFFVTEGAEREALARFGAPTERFSVGVLDVAVYETRALPMGWLDLPLPRGRAIRYPLRLPASSDAFQVDKAEVTPDGVLGTGAEGQLVHGPFLDMSRGSYVAVWTGRVVEDRGRIAFDVYVGGKVLASETAHTELPRLLFTLDRDTDGVELLVRSEGGGRVLLDAVTLERR